jgi:3-hydroxyanthranilate 3,4-dioxygenase
MLMSKLTTLNFKRWIEENRHLLKPPVGNKCVFDGDLIVMVIGGPNARTDYHVNQGEEFFYQIEGDIVLKVIDDGLPRSIEINEGDIFLLPAGVPHSPQRPAGSIGLVIERKRAKGVLDAFQWHCEQCSEKLYEESFQLENIATQFPAIFDRFYSSADHTTCKKCGTQLKRPKQLV